MERGVSKEWQKYCLLRCTSLRKFNDNIDREAGVYEISKLIGYLRLRMSRARKIWNNEKVTDFNLKHKQFIQSKKDIKKDCFRDLAENGSNRGGLQRSVGINYSVIEISVCITGIV